MERSGVLAPYIPFSVEPVFCNPGKVWLFTFPQYTVPMVNDRRAFWRKIYSLNICCVAPSFLWGTWPPFQARASLGWGQGKARWGLLHRIKGGVALKVLWRWSYTCITQEGVPSPTLHPGGLSCLPRDLAQSWAWKAQIWEHTERLLTVYCGDSAQTSVQQMSSFSTYTK